jgi:hypothetical protein
VAVWIYAYGKNELVSADTIVQESYLELLNNIPVDGAKILDSLLAELSKGSVEQRYNENRANLQKHFDSLTDKAYSAYLASIKLPHVDRDKIIDHFIADGTAKEKKKKLRLTTARDQFESGELQPKWDQVSGIGYINHLHCLENYDGLKVRIVNDLINITGPFSTFSHYAIFQDVLPTELKEYYHTLFKTILASFGSNFILWAHEWTGLDDHEDDDYNYEKLFKEANWNENSSESLHTMKGLYHEEL